MADPSLTRIQAVEQRENALAVAVPGDDVVDESARTFPITGPQRSGRVFEAVLEVSATLGLRRPRLGQSSSRLVVPGVAEQDATEGESGLAGATRTEEIPPQPHEPAHPLRRTFQSSLLPTSPDVASIMGKTPLGFKAKVRLG